MSEFKCPSCWSKIKGWHYIECEVLKSARESGRRVYPLPISHEDRRTLLALDRSASALFVLAVALVFSLVLVHIIR